MGLFDDIPYAVCSKPWLDRTFNDLSVCSRQSLLRVSNLSPDTTVGDVLLFLLAFLSLFIAAYWLTTALTKAETIAGGKFAKPVSDRTVFGWWLLVMSTIAASIAIKAMQPHVQWEYVFWVLLPLAIAAKIIWRRHRGKPLEPTERGPSSLREAVEKHRAEKSRLSPPG